MRTSQISKLYLAKTKNLKHENIFLSAKPFQRAEEWDCRWEKQFIKKKNFFNLHFALRLARTGTNKKGFFLQEFKFFRLQRVGWAGMLRGIREVQVSRSKGEEKGCWCQQVF